MEAVQLKLTAVSPFSVAVTLPGTLGATVSTKVFLTAKILLEFPPTFIVICLPVAPPACTVIVSDSF
ncbi:hypothetical protein D3C78_1421680 [compost metagenome]